MAVNVTTGTSLDGPAINGITVVMRDGDDNVAMAKGASVPSSAAGYAKGCLFIKTNGGANTTLYVNEGTATTSSFAAK